MSSSLYFLRHASLAVALQFRFSDADVNSLMKNLALVHQITTLCRACNEMPGDNECESCHRFFCDTCTPSHLEQEKRDIEQRNGNKILALKNRRCHLLEKLEVVEEKINSFLSKLRGDIEKKVADAENNISCIEKVEEVAAHEDTLLEKMQDFVDKMESTGESGLPTNPCYTFHLIQLSKM